MSILFELTKNIMNDVTRPAADSVRTRRGILALDHEHKPIRYIAKRISRSKSVVLNFLRETTKHVMRKQTRRPRKISPRMAQNIFCSIEQGNHTAKEVKSALNLSVHVSSVQSFSCKLKEVSWMKLMFAPPLKKLHMKERICWEQIDVGYSLEQ